MTEKKKPGRPKKKKKLDVSLNFRCNSQQYARWNQCAETADKSTQRWMRDVLDLAAAIELQGKGD